jgi:type IV pilus assembly protein PilA
MLRNKNAFTLIELMVVIVIIGILATLAIPKFNEASLKAKVAEAPTVLSSYDNAQLAYIAEAAATGAVGSLVMEDPTAIGSNYFTYTDAFTASDKDAGLTATAAAAGMGDVASKTIKTVVTTAQVVTHTKDEDAYAKYLPNWK